MAAIDIGRLRRRVTLEEAVDTPDGAGGTTRNWSPVARVWALVEALPATTVFEADARGQRVTHRITIRAREGLTLSCRLRTGTGFHQPRSFHTIDDAGRFVAIMTEEAAP